MDFLQLTGARIAALNKVTTLALVAGIAVGAICTNPAMAATVAVTGTISQSSSTSIHLEKGAATLLEGFKEETQKDDPVAIEVGLKKFDGTLGTLNSVSWSIEASLTIDASLVSGCISVALGWCNSDFNSTFGVYTTLGVLSSGFQKMDISFDGWETVSDTLETGSWAGCLVEAASNELLGIGDPDCITKISHSITDTVIFNDPNIANYIYVDDGSDVTTVPGKNADEIYMYLNTALRIWSDITCTMNGVGVTVCIGDSDATGEVSATATITYDYSPHPAPEPVPLPAGFPLLLGGLVGLGAMARTRRAVSV